MAIAMRTFGNTLTDLQAGTNADKGLDYQRANAQDAINQQRLEAFLRLQGQKYQTQAQQNALAADRAQRMAELIQQNSQFGTSEANAMKRAELDAQTRKDVAKTTADARGMDPRLLDSFNDIQIFNREGQNRVTEAGQLSQQRQAALAEISAAEADGYIWNSKAYGEWKKVFGREPNKKAATEALNAINLRAGALGLIPRADGGFELPNFQPLQMPNIGRSGLQTPPVTPPQSQVPAMLLPGRSDVEVVPGSAFDRLLNPVPVVPQMYQPPTVPSPRRVLRFDAGTMDFVP